MILIAINTSREDRYLHRPPGFCSSQVTLCAKTQATSQTCCYEDIGCDVLCPSDIDDGCSVQVIEDTLSLCDMKVKHSRFFAGNFCLFKLLCFSPEFANVCPQPRLGPEWLWNSCLPHSSVSSASSLIRILIFSIPRLWMDFIAILARHALIAKILPRGLCRELEITEVLQSPVYPR